MELSFYSLLTSVAWSGLLLGILMLCRKMIRGFWRYETAALYLLLLGCVFRCFFPLEFSGFTQPLSFRDGIYANAYLFLTGRVSVSTAANDSSFRVLPMTVVTGVWCVVAVFLLFRFLVKYRSMARSWELYEEVSSGAAYDKAAFLCRELKIKKVCILQDELITVPQVCGLRYPRILLPDRSYTDSELHYILSHELTHWKNGDITLRFLVCLARAVFWWNPFLHLLPRYLEETQELRCDITVVRRQCKTDQARIAYLDTLLRALLEAGCCSRQPDFSMEARAGLVEAPGKKELLQKRADVIANYVPHSKRERCAVVLALCFLLFSMFVSYRYVFVPGSNPPKEDLRNELTADTQYLVSDGNFYWIYSVNGDIPPQRISQQSGEMMLENGFPLKENLE